MTQAVCCVLIVIIAAADRLLKRLVVASSLADGSVITLIPGILQLSYVENTGAAFGIFTGKTLFLSVLSLLIIIGGLVLIISGKIKSKLLRAAAVMLIGGGIGNLIDRFAKGYVVDYIEVLFVDFPVFNLADCFVTVGEFILVGWLLYGTLKDFMGKKNEG